MVFFNYATMQMAAKIVYYGPGLCGKTTNLHFIYSRTSPGSRGEMVSLETETDRTLFFDLLPLDVGVIGGFKTRVQLYTVPGQVFYNTTRKLVLKGVDGIVFVADSQKAMKEANVESLNNLRVNLAEIGLQLDDLPLVFQFNKRDLSNTSSVEELNQSLNPQGRHESYEASAVLGQGVFETLKAISKLTLRSLKKRMLGEDRPARPGAGASTAPMPAVAEAVVETAMPLPEPAAKSVPPAAPQEAPKQISLRDFAVAPQPHQPPPAEQPPASPPKPFEPPKPPPPPVLHGSDAFDAGDVETVQEFEQALNSLDAPLPEPEELTEEVEIGDVSFAKAPEPEEVAPEDVKHVRVRSNIDILAELEKLRKNATAAPLTPKPTRRATEGISIDDLLASSLNHRKEINRVFELEVPRGELKRGHQVSIDLRLEDKDKNTVGEEKSFSIELHSRSDIEKLLLSLKFHIQGK